MPSCTLGRAAPVRLCLDHLLPLRDPVPACSLHHRQFVDLLDFATSFLPLETDALWKKTNAFVATLNRELLHDAPPPRSETRLGDELCMLHLLPIPASDTSVLPDDYALFVDSVSLPSNDLHDLHDLIIPASEVSIDFVNPELSAFSDVHASLSLDIDSAFRAPAAGKVGRSPTEVDTLFPKLNDLSPQADAKPDDLACHDEPCPLPDDLHAECMPSDENPQVRPAVAARPAGRPLLRAPLQVPRHVPLQVPRREVPLRAPLQVPRRAVPLRPKLRTLRAPAASEFSRPSAEVDALLPKQHDSCLNTNACNASTTPTDLLLTCPPAEVDTQLSHQNDSFLSADVCNASDTPIDRSLTSSSAEVDAPLPKQFDSYLNAASHAPADRIFCRSSAEIDTQFSKRADPNLRLRRRICWLNLHACIAPAIRFLDVQKPLLQIGDSRAMHLLRSVEAKSASLRNPTNYILSACHKALHSDLCN